MSLKHLNVLIVDDNDMMRSLLGGILRNGGHNVIGEASNAPTAIEMANRLKPDIVCLDIVMPGEMDGLEALVEIKKDRSQTQVVMITGNADQDTVQEAINNGASGFIVKPFNAARVLDTLEIIMRRSMKKRGT
ncbi:response regulator [Dechloromonas sp. ZS-1]|uniref:response regulator n=1 Tax=Dechloromonas sp. ZS-1 TaxID=3138067 RepID=UPI0031FBFCFF